MADDDAGYRYYYTDESTWTFEQKDAVITFIQDQRLDVRYTSRDALVRSFLRDNLVEQGLTPMMKELFWVEESVVPPKTPRPLYLDMVSKMVAKLQPNQSLRLVDTYLWKRNEFSVAEYVADLVAAVRPAIEAGVSLSFYYGKRDDEVQEGLCGAVVAMGYGNEVSCHRVTNFHDRFITIDDNSGLFLGASFNSVGRSYSLVDYLLADDAAEIASALRAMERSDP